MPLTSQGIKSEAHRLGFDLCGIAPAANFPELRFLREWLDRGYAGDMAYLERTADRRSDIKAVLPSARSVIVAAMLYNTDRRYSTEVNDGGRAEIARYAWGDDYHDVMGCKLEDLLRWMREVAGQPFDATWYVDTGPVQERVYAQYAGLGWIGKNTCLINPALGSWLFLSEIIVSLDLDPDEPAADQCGRCTLCLEACPTGALDEPGVLDATRCISYATIERRGPIPEEDRDGLGTHVYGCDICQEVCPWNMRPVVSTRSEWLPRPAFDRPRLAELWRASDEQLRQSLKGSAMSRAKLVGLRRNIAVAIGNGGRAEDAAALEDDESGGSRSPSKDDEVVREHVSWARRKIGSR